MDDGAVNVCAVESEHENVFRHKNTKQHNKYRNWFFS